MVSSRPTEGNRRRVCKECVRGRQRGKVTSTRATEPAKRRPPNLPYCGRRISSPLKLFMLQWRGNWRHQKRNFFFTDTILVNEGHHYSNFPSQKQFSQNVRHAGCCQGISLGKGEGSASVLIPPCGYCCPAHVKRKNGVKQLIHVCPSVHKSPLMIKEQLI